MIRTFRRQFMAIAMCAMAGSLVVMLLLINALNFAMTQEELRGTLELISENKGSMPSYREGQKPPRRGMSHESQYETRYFSVAFMDSEKPPVINVKQIASVDRDAALEYANEAIAKQREFGYMDQFIYHVDEKESGRVRVCFLDWQNKRAALIRFAFSSALMGLAGLGMTFFIVLRLSGRAVQPLIKSEIKQKQFITDASHELKTPLSVIAVNMDVLKMDVGDNEWIESTQQQVARLRKLVDQLMTMARLDEQGTEFEKKKFSLSDALLETASPFEALALAQGKQFEMHIQENVTLCANEEMIRRMIGVLVDNAVKYAQEPGNIVVELSGRKAECEISVCNRYLPAERNPDLSCMFDRFYRADESRNRERQDMGFGVGLSIAQKVVQWHQGKIRALMKDEETLCFQVILPR